MKVNKKKQERQEMQEKQERQEMQEMQEKQKKQEINQIPNNNSNFNEAPRSKSRLNLDNIKNENNLLDLTEDQFYIALGHEIRRTILKIIGDKGFSGFSTFKKQIQASTGTIYHHLDVIKDLIYQDKKKKYHLTRLGEHAYQELGKNLESIEVMAKLDEEKRKYDRKGIFDHFLLKKVFNFYLNHSTKGIMLTFGIIFTIGILCGINDFQIYLFFIKRINIEDSFLFYFILSVMSAFFSYILLFCTTEILCHFIFNKHENWKQFLTILSISYFPIVFYLGLVSILNLLIKNIDSLIFDIFLLLFQAWSMILLAHAISITKTVKFERGLLIAVFIDYGTFMIMLIVNNPF